MTQPQQDGPDLGEPTDVTVDPDAIDDAAAGDTPTSSAAGYEQGDTEGGTGGLDAGGAG